MSDQPDPMTFTGERFTPECVREIWYEHWHRYAFARSLAGGKRVLDAACGEGYGSSMLADVAASVVGVDISNEAVAHARARYAGARDNLRFEAGDAAALGLAERSFDLVVSFETLEHLAAQTDLVAGFARVLRDDGLLLVSCPDKLTYSDIAGFRNEYHVRELYRDELLALLAPHFSHVRLYGQKLLFQSALWALDGQAGGAAVVTSDRDGKSIVDGFDYAPLYHFAICSRVPLPTSLPALSLFGDREESVYAHYNGEVRTNMNSGARIAELETELARLRASHAAESPPWWRRWLK